jgi:hypothetical protein
VRLRRRDILKLPAAWLLLPLETPFFRTRGVVLVPEDLTLADWPERAKAAGLTTIALHHGLMPKVVMDFVQSPEGTRFLTRCRELHLEVEYELHAMSQLLPRDLFARQPDLFRMNDEGVRTADANLCVSSAEALDIVGRNADTISQVLKPTTGRFFLWGDDARPWCRCPKCRGLSDSDQALVMENHLIGAIRKIDNSARLAHLAYANTLEAPRQVKPDRGIFLEYAPISRRYDIPYAQQTGSSFQDALDALDGNLDVFGRDSAQVLEYWLDVSRFSKYKKPPEKLPWMQSVFAADLDTYGSRGLRHVTTFAVYIDREYVSLYGEPPLAEYGSKLSAWQPRR